MPVPGYGVSSAIPRGGNRFYICAMDLFNYHRRSTTEVHIGNTPLGGSNPIRIQSMTNTHTHETEPCVEQCIRIIDAGADYVRLTAQGTREAENLACIEDELHRRGYHTPLVADIHFNPHVADIAAGIVEKVRINPGNFVDSARTFKHIDYTDEEYAAELQRLRNRLIQLLEICRKHHTAIRIGVNHGSLSDRIMSRYGDTPEGIVESCMEFLRVCRDENFTDVVISIKASNTVVMVKSVRLLLAALEKGNIHYPLHLGVTEAGEGEDGRIKSAVGIGTLLADGIGDTIRVSLSEAPEAEIPVARTLVDYITARAQHPHINGVKADAYDFLHMERRSSKAVHNIGGGKVPVIISDHLSDVSDGNLQPDFLYIEKDNEIISYPGEETSRQTVSPLFTANGLQQLEASDAEIKFLQLSYPELNERIWDTIENIPGIVVILTSRHINPVGECRAFFHALLRRKCTVPVVVQLTYAENTLEDLQLKAAADFGALLLDGFADGIWLRNTGNIPAEKILACMYGILQAARQRTSKTEYISCPGCGRTLFDLTQTIARVKAATSHLKTLKIGIMGCIVNGPGEMADADYGYVGAGRNRISLYKGKTCIEKNIPEDEAVQHLIELIKKNGDWIEP